MNLLDRVCELWGRTLSPIETQKIINLSNEFSEEVILEAAMISADKNLPMQYMARTLYYVKHPTEQGKKKEKVEVEPVEDTNSKWLEEFKKSLN